MGIESLGHGESVAQQGREDWAWWCGGRAKGDGQARRNKATAGKTSSELPNPAEMTVAVDQSSKGVVDGMAATMDRVVVQAVAKVKVRSVIIRLEKLAEGLLERRTRTWGRSG